MKDPIANFAQVLVKAKAIKPAVGGFATLLGLAAVLVADKVSQPFLYWVTGGSASCFYLLGLVL
jgi:hypothetical protein